VLRFFEIAELVNNVEQVVR